MRAYLDAAQGNREGLSVIGRGGKAMTQEDVLNYLYKMQYKLFRKEFRDIREQIRAGMYDEAYTEIRRRTRGAQHEPTATAASNEGYASMAKERKC